MNYLKPNGERKLTTGTTGKASKSVIPTERSDEEPNTSVPETVQSCKSKAWNGLGDYGFDSSDERNLILGMTTKRAK